MTNADKMSNLLVKKDTSHKGFQSLHFCHGLMFNTVMTQYKVGVTISMN